MGPHLHNAVMAQQCAASTAIDAIRNAVKVIDIFGILLVVLDAINSPVRTWQAYSIALVGCVDGSTHRNGHPLRLLRRIGCNAPFLFPFIHQDR